MADASEFADYPRGRDEDGPWVWDRFFAYTKVGLSVVFGIWVLLKEFSGPQDSDYRTAGVAALVFTVVLALIAATGRRWAFGIFFVLFLLSFIGVVAVWYRGWRPGLDVSWWVSNIFELVFGIYAFLRATGWLGPIVVVQRKAKSSSDRGIG